MNGKGLPAIIGNEVMTVSFMVAEEKVLAMGGRSLPPIRQGRLNGRNGRMAVKFKRDSVKIEKTQHFAYPRIHLGIFKE